MTTTILMDDDPQLRVKSQPVEDFAAVRELIATMKQIVANRRARGLAAIQIGVPLRVMIVREGDEYRALINPRITRTLNRFTTEREGCLSISPRYWGDVSRPAKCDAVWFNENGDQHSATLTGETARIFQHELDHFEGILMTDYYLVRTRAAVVGQP